jgi:3-deoxy-manno-octulosonate cytidylyltransferase (CMP-KDO synthetase)
MSFKVIIPARYASTRLPGKALLMLQNKPIVQHVYDNACASGAEDVVIATDDMRIVEAGKKFNANICLT